MSCVSVRTNDAPQFVSKCRFPRHKIDTSVSVDLGSGNDGILLNLNKGGVGFKGAQPLQKGVAIPIKFKLPGTRVALQTTGQIAWLDELGLSGGLRFTELPDETRRRINRWLAMQTESSNQIVAAPEVLTTVPRWSPPTESFSSTRRNWKRMMPLAIGLIVAAALIGLCFAIPAMISSEKITGEFSSRPRFEYGAPKPPDFWSARTAPSGDASMDAAIPDRIAENTEALTAPSATGRPRPASEPHEN